MPPPLTVPGAPAIAPLVEDAAIVVEEAPAPTQPKSSDPTSSALSDRHRESEQESGGCSSMNGLGQISNNLVLMLFTLMGALRARYARRK